MIHTVVKSTKNVWILTMSFGIIERSQIISVCLSYYYLIRNDFGYLKPALFRNKRFTLNEMFLQNASKFAIFYV